MPRLSSIIEFEVKTIVVPVGSVEVTLTFFPGKFSWAFMERLQQLGDGEGEEQIARIQRLFEDFTRLVKRWDLTDDDDQPLPITVDACKELGIGLVTEMIQEMGSSLTPKAESSTSSPASSSTRTTTKSSSRKAASASRATST